MQNKSENCFAVSRVLHVLLLEGQVAAHDPLHPYTPQLFAQYFPSPQSLSSLQAPLPGAFPSLLLEGQFAAHAPIYPATLFAQYFPSPQSLSSLQAALRDQVIIDQEPTWLFVGPTQR